LFAKKEQTALNRKDTKKER